MMVSSSEDRKGSAKRALVSKGQGAGWCVPRGLSSESQKCAFNGAQGDRAANPEHGVQDTPTVFAYAPKISEGEWKYPVMLDYDKGLDERWQRVAFERGASYATIYRTRPGHYNVVLYFSRVVSREEAIEIMTGAGCDPGYIAVVKRKGLGMRITPRHENGPNGARTVPERVMVGAWTR